MIEVSSQSQEKLKLELEEESVRKYQKHKHHIKTGQTVPLQGETSRISTLITSTGSPSLRRGGK